MISTQNPEWLQYLRRDFSQDFLNYQPENLNVFVAQKVAENLCRTIAAQNQNRGFETLEIHPHLLGRVLACDVIAPIDVPGFDNAAMDGWAFCSASAAHASGETFSLREVATVLAGHAGALPTVGTAECVRITTGAPLPLGCDTVVPWERVRVEKQENIKENNELNPIIHIPKTAAVVGANCRQRGQDLAAGAVAIAAGTRLTAAHLGLAASLGLSALRVVRKLRVAYFSTGDELRNAAQGLNIGAAQSNIFDSNRTTISAILTKIGCEIIDLPTAPDQPDAIDAAIAQAMAQGADAIVTTGGTSLGAADHTRTRLQQRAQAVAWQLALRPGRPFTLAAVCREPMQEGATSAQNGLSCARGLGDLVPIFGLPGNPLAALVTFTLITRPALARLAGVTSAWVLPALTTAILGEAIHKKPGRTEVLFAQLAPGAAIGDIASVAPLAQQSSGALSSATRANALIVLPTECTHVTNGTFVGVWPMDLIL